MAGLFGQSVSSYTPTVTERVPQVIQDTLMRMGVNKRTANTYAYKAAGLLGYTPVGAATAAIDAGVAAQQRPTLMGKAAGLGGGLAMAALGAVPGGRGVAAKGEKLAMDEASRMARAAEQGFDVASPWYHGTPHEFDAFDVERGQPGMVSGYAPHFANLKDEAAGYAERGGGNRVIEALVRSEKPLLVSGRNPSEKLPLDVYELIAGGPPRNPEWLSLRDAQNQVASGMMKPDAPYPHKESWKVVYDRLRAAGYDAIKWTDVPADFAGGDRYDKLTPLFAENIRDKRAAFDPAKRNSRDLLAGIGAVGGAGTFGLLSQQPQRQDY